jgi:uncharacterized protein YebE (UPF0316 family)
MLDCAAETFRWIITVRRMKVLAATIAFVEVLIWLIIFREVVLATKGWLCYVAYAGGYSIGTYLGIVLSDKFIKEKKIVRRGKKK